MSIKKNMWILIILLLTFILYYFIINSVVWHLKNSFDFDSSKLKEVVHSGENEMKLKIKHEYPLVNLSKCNLMIYGSNINSDDELLYSGKFEKEITLTKVDKDYILSFQLIKNNKVFIYSSKGGAIKVNAKEATVTLLLQHSDKYHGYYKLNY